MTTVTLPQAPGTTSPVPHLTSIHSTPQRGPWGNWRYPGNCSGHIIRDLLQFFDPKTVFDPMSGSGTCKDVCRELGIPCSSADLHQRFDACDPRHYPQEKFDFIWTHPPYWRMKRYGDDPRCLSNAPSEKDFFLRMTAMLRCCKRVLANGGKLAVLMGDYYDVKLQKMIPCCHMTKEAALREGYWPACTDIVRFQHGNSSSRKSYTSSFIPGLHDVCSIYQLAKTPCLE